METTTKNFEKLDLKLEEGSREVVFTISTSAVDRDGDVMLPKGLKKKNYAGNPVVLLNHDLSSLPIGSTRWIKPDGPDRLIGKAYISDKTQLARDVFGLVQDGVIVAASVGAFILEASPPTTKELRDRPEWANAKRIVRSWEIYEWSLCTVPVNQEALMLAVSKGYSPETIKFLNRRRVPEARDDMWDWPAEASTAVDVAPKSCTAVQFSEPVVKPSTAVEPVVADKLAGLPVPKSCRPLASVVAMKLARLELKTEDDVLRKYLGRIA